MSNRAKFLISTLFIVVIILCIGLTRFYFDVTKNTGITNDEERIASVIRQYSNGTQLFESTNGYYGLLDEEGAILIEPEWMEVLAVTSDVVIVSKRMNDQVLIGGIDYESNVVLPMAFRSMTKLNDSYYLGTVAADDSCIIYDALTFAPAFSDSWDSVECNDDLLYLEKDGCRFIYDIPEKKKIIKKAEMQSVIGTEVLDWELKNSVYLSELQYDGLLEMNRSTTAYIDMLITNDFSELERISSAEYVSGLSKNDIFSGATFDNICDFSFTTTIENGTRIYDFAFTIEYHTRGESGERLDQRVQMQLYYQKNTENRVILTSANMDFHSNEVVEQETQPDGE